MLRGTAGLVETFDITQFPSKVVKYSKRRPALFARRLSPQPRTRRSSMSCHRQLIGPVLMIEGDFDSSYPQELSLLNPALSRC